MIILTDFQFFGAAHHAFRWNPSKFGFFNFKPTGKLGTRQGNGNPVTGLGCKTMDTALRTLDLSFTGVADMSVLACCPGLRVLNVSYTDAFSTIRDMCSTHGYALNDVLRHLATLVLGMQLPPAVLALLRDELSTIEWRLASGASDKHQLAALVGAFMVAREMMTPPDSSSAAMEQ